MEITNRVDHITNMVQREMDEMKTMVQKEMDEMKAVMIRQQAAVNPELLRSCVVNTSERSSGNVASTMAFWEEVYKKKKKKSKCV